MEVGWTPLTTNAGVYRHWLGRGVESRYRATTNSENFQSEEEQIDRTRPAR